MLDILSKSAKFGQPPTDMWLQTKCGQQTQEDETCSERGIEINQFSVKVCLSVEVLNQVICLLISVFILCDFMICLLFQTANKTPTKKTAVCK